MRDELQRLRTINAELYAALKNLEAHAACVPNRSDDFSNAIGEARATLLKAEGREG